eukprot:TRINITY_DN9018_c0_g1_i1.p1 TRINITY_DN9018_c0_g1~~TRINITY_DN9018_c0_g1_i1.p1  ORF type:complete len:884 (-),score=164.69 TRINITY_DN9018_c0_g1_i1:953-3604(-)
MSSDSKDPLIGNNYKVDLPSQINEPNEAGLSQIIGNLVLSVRYVWAETKKSKRNFLVGCTTIFLVVFALSVLQTAVEVAPILFLKLAEDSVGEYDLVMIPGKSTQSNSFFLNTTEIREKLQDEPNTNGVVPRWIFLSDALNAEQRNQNGSTIILMIDSEKEKKIGLGREWKHDTLKGASAHVSSALLHQIGVEPNNGEKITLYVNLLSLINAVSSSELSEAEILESQLSTYLIEMFRNGDSSRKESEINSLLMMLLQETVPFYGNTFGELLSENGITITDVNNIRLSSSIINSLKQILSFEFDVEVIDEITAPHGKYPAGLGNVVMLDTDVFFDIKPTILENIKQFDLNYLIELFFPDLGIAGKLIVPAIEEYLGLDFDKMTENITNIIEDANIDEYALMCISMYTDRFTAFIKTKTEIDFAVIDWTDKIMEKLGLNYAIEFEIPLISAMRLIYFLRLFLDQILMMVELFLISLGVFLIYSLMLADVEGKVYECGMLRALGMEQYALIELLVVQSFMFSIPGIVIGLICAFFAFLPVRNFISGFSLIPIAWRLTPKAVLLAVSVGTFIPLVSLIGPIQKSLSQALRDALDLYHSNQNDTKVIFKKLENLGLSSMQTSLSILAVSFGFIVYYLVPYSFIFFHWALFFNIFVGILLGMVFGLALLALTLHPFTQGMFVNLIMLGSDRRKLKRLVEKNLIGHARRNSKTAILFTTCVAFILFAGTVFTLQGHNIVAQAKVGIGADLVIQSFSMHSPLDHEPMRDYLDKEKEKENANVLDYTFSTFPLDSMEHIRWTDIANLADFSDKSSLIIGVEENFLNVTFDQYASVTESSSKVQYRKTNTGNNDIIRSLYEFPTNASDIKVPDLVNSGKKYGFVGNIDYKTNK